METMVFGEYLKDALGHLYDPDVLRGSPLLKAGGLVGRPNAPFELQQILTEAVQAMKPPQGEPPDSRGWRLYYALFYCYVQQFSQSQAADQMGISVRQLRRDQYTAIDSLVFVLVKKFGFQVPAGPDEPPMQPEDVGEAPPLEDLPGEREAVLSQVIPPVLEMLRTVSEKYNVPIQVELPPDLPAAEVHPVILRQMLLSILSQALRLPGSAGITLRASLQDRLVRIHALCSLQGPPASTVQELASSLSETAEKLVALSGGSMEIVNRENNLEVCLSFPTLRKLAVIVLDDNLDTLHLLKRYGQGSPFHIIDTQDPEAVFPLAEAHQPRVIFLDIMMPKVDGWEVLSRLRQHPSTQNAMIYICSILYEPDLAVELGATGFLRKPVKREEFLSILQQAARQD